MKKENIETVKVSRERLTFCFNASDERISFESRRAATDRVVINYITSRV